RPHAVPVALSTTIRAVRDWTGQRNPPAETQLTPSAENALAAIPHRPRAVPAALSTTIRAVRDWTGQMRAVRHERQSVAPGSQESIEQADTVALLSASNARQARPEAFDQAPTQMLPQFFVGSPASPQPVLNPDALSIFRHQPKQIG